MQHINHEGIKDINAYWFGQLDANGQCLEDHNALWFSANATTDEALRRQFGALLTQGLAGQLNAWSDSDEGLIALIVLLDQFTRNIHRGTALAFDGDAQALALAQAAIADGRHLQLPAIHRVFLYLPLEHHEDLATQNHCVALFEELSAALKNTQFDSFKRYAVAHREVIEKFGRFPHRNAMLGRTSSAPELAYLEKHGGF